MRMGAAHKCGVPHAGKADVIDEASFAEKQRAVLETRNARSDQSTHLIDRVRVSQSGPFAMILNVVLVRHRFGGLGDHVLGRGIGLG